MRRREAVSNVHVDHEAKTVTGWVQLPELDPCPHRLRIRDDDGRPVDVPCAGKGVHPSGEHADVTGRYRW